jgi:foldase protein PrsA
MRFTETNMTERRLPVVLRMLMVFATAVAVLLVAGCGGGGGMPSGAAATVDGTPIKSSDVNRWITITAQEDAAVIRHSPNDRKPVPADVPVPAPPTYERCVAALEGQPSSKGKSRAALKRECQRQYESLKERALTFLVQSQWLLKEARARNVEAASSAVQAQANAEVKRLYGTQARFRQFLARSNMTMADFLFRSKIEVLNNEIEQTVHISDSVSEAQIRAYYRQNRERLFKAGARRDILMVLAKTRGAAEQAKRELQSGTGWGIVAKKYSLNPSPTSLIVESPHPPPYQRAVFTAKNGHLTGPISTGVGFLIFSVTARRPASPLTLAEAHETVASLVRSDERGSRIRRFLDGYQRRYRSQTECASGFLVLTLCRNAPKPKPSASLGGGRTTGNTASG